MRFRILALDYDGTIARDGRIDPAVRSSVEEVRRQGVVVVLVTGRILQDLRCNLGSLRLLTRWSRRTGRSSCSLTRGRR